GFCFSGIQAGIKKNGTLDLGLILADEVVSAAGVFTQNRVRAAPVAIAEQRIRKGKIRAILVNSGNANCLTGKDGERAAKESTRLLAQAIGSSAEFVVPASTGVIGVPLPLEAITAKISDLLCAASPKGVFDFARAILTTDRWPKVAFTTFPAGGMEGTLLGIAKGAGMIHPELGTMLAFALTDVGIPPSLLRPILKEAVEGSFNGISVDGDTSTNDAVFVLASGKKCNLGRNRFLLRNFAQALKEVFQALAGSIVRDGEGAEHLVTIEVKGSRSDADAKKAACAIATSLLVKTALHGCEANWVRILAAAGRSGARFDPMQVSVRIGGVTVFQEGTPVGAHAEAQAAEIMKSHEYTIEVSLGRGRGHARYLTCDLGPQYVAINASYRT
ncbi:MAG: bifunctional glutamate N-acetyltransferase/amino-acid acetyltransferase ArgJ, partial [Deltaproteobacteria bacterium]|nr:bifunctional glutamate N-acetyltransferase/amino-acid acetyltransferase ArgJ [Deltaproteobacteria bacterium]